MVHWKVHGAECNSAGDPARLWLSITVDRISSVYHCGITTTHKVTSDSRQSRQSQHGNVCANTRCVLLPNLGQDVCEMNIYTHRQVMHIKPAQTYL